MNDLIKRQDAITAFCEHECGKGMTREKCGAVDCGTIFDDISSAQQWIPVNEQKPEGEVLCCNIYGDMIVGYVYKDISCDTGFSAESEGENLTNVTAWMPLPEPYKEVKDEE